MNLNKDSTDVLVSMLEQPEWQGKIEQAIGSGKDKGYLTHADLQEEVGISSSHELFELFVLSVRRQGVAVYRTPDDIPEDLLDDSAEESSSSEPAAEEEIQSSERDTEGGGDPMKMYLQEMGRVALLTREQEVEIARRIEAGLLEVMRNLIGSPTIVAAVIEKYEQVEANEWKNKAEFVESLANAEPDVPLAEAVPEVTDVDVDDDSEEEEEAEVEEEVVASPTAHQEKMSAAQDAALERIRECLPKMKSLLKRVQKGEIEGDKFEKDRQAVLTGLDDVRFAPAFVERLKTYATELSTFIQREERAIAALVVDRAGLERRRFVMTFQKRSTDETWLSSEMRAIKEPARLKIKERLKEVAPKVK